MVGVGLPSELEKIAGQMGGGLPSMRG